MLPPPATIRRHFLSWDRPFLPQVVAWLAGDWRGEGALDLSRLLAIVPTRQAGRRLREALASYAAVRGQAVLPPRVLTPDAWAVFDLGPGVASSVDTLLGWTEVFQAIDLDAFRNIFPVDPPVRNFPWALQLAREFTHLQVTLAEAGLRFGDVAARAGDDFVESGRWNELATLEELHAAQLAEHLLLDPHAAAIDAAAQSWDDGRFDRVVVLAVPDPQPSALRRLASAAESRPVDLVVFAPADEAAAFDEWGRPRPAVWSERVLHLPSFEERVHLCADPAAQAARVAALAGRYTAPEGVLALGIADTEITPLLENELIRRQRPAFNPEGRAMSREAIFELLSQLAAVAREPSFGNVSALARCPDFFAYLRGVVGRDFSVARWLAGLDQLRARHLPVDLAAALEHAPKLGRYPELGAGLEAIKRLRELLEEGTFAESVMAALTEIFRGRQLDLARREDTRLEEAASLWADVLRDCAQAGQRCEGVAAADWWDLALRLFAERRAADEKPAGALELQGWLEVLWEDAPHLAVAGLNDGHVPEAVVEDAFLPESLRLRLGLKTNAARFARDAYILQAIAACRGESGRLDLLFGKNSAAGDPLRPSRLLLRCPDGELPPRIAILFRAPEIAETNVAWTRAWKLTPRVAAPPAKVAVTALRRYLLCPFRFYLRHVLGMESVDPLKSELDAFDFGTLCHAALEQIGLQPALRDCTDPVVLRRELLHSLDGAVRERYGTRLSLPLLVQAESARQRLARLAELQAEQRAAGWVIAQVERAFEVEVSGVLVRGKIDRIDRHLDTGAIRVLDYKTSDAPVAPADAHLRALRPGEPVPEWARFDEAGKPRAWSDLQLPLYLHALAAEFSPRPACGYFNLPKAAGETTLALWEDYTPELHESAVRCAMGACAAIRAGAYWPPNEMVRAERDECAALFHHGVEASVEWIAPR